MMKVDGSLPAVALTGSTGKAPVREKETSASATGQDSVSLSDASSQLRSLEVSVNESSGFDAGKVAAIKLAISEGSFNVDANRIADRLIANSRESISQQKA
jgi:negative regulator of flagellin synthesis FlgM